MIAYLVSAEPFYESEIGRVLSYTLPLYMVSDHYLLVTEIPLTNNGKVDRKRLPEPALRKVTERNACTKPRRTSC